MRATRKQPSSAVRAGEQRVGRAWVAWLTSTRFAARYSTTVAVFSAALLVLPHDLIAQDAQGSVIGQVRRSRAVSGGPSCTRSEHRVPKDAIRISGPGTPRARGAIPPPEPVRVGDTIRVTPFVNARVSLVDTTFGLGDVVLAPQILCGIVGLDNTAITPTDGSGQYDIQRRGDTLVFTAHHGGAYFQWADSLRRCRFQIVAAHVTGEVCGTRIVVAVDTSGKWGLIYVMEGTVRFRDWPGLQAQAGELFQLDSAARPRRASVEQTASRINRDAIRYHATDVWRPPWRQFLGRAVRNPWTYVIGGAVAAAAIWNANQEDSPGGGTKTVRITIPL